MFRSRVFGPPDGFHLVLEYGTAGNVSPNIVRLALPHARLEFDWTSSEPELQVVERFVQRHSQLLLDNRQERVVLQLAQHPAIAQSPATTHQQQLLHQQRQQQRLQQQHEQQLQVTLQVASSPPVLRSLHFSRTSGSGNVLESLVAALLKHVDLSGVWKLRGCDGLGNFWATCTGPNQWRCIKHLNLSSCGLTALPSSIGQLHPLQVLWLNHNKLTNLPAEIGQLVELEVLSVNHNQLTTLPAELRHCSRLRELHLEHNRITTPLMDLTHAAALASLQLYGNPLEYLPELAPAVALRSLSLANMRIMADAAYSRWEVEVTAPSSNSYTSMVIGNRGHKLQPLFNLVFRRSSIQHPLLTGAISRLIEDPANLELLVREDVALQQLVLAAMSSNSTVVVQAVRVIVAAGSHAGATARLVKHNAVQAIFALLASNTASLQLSGLRMLSSLAAGAGEGEVPGEVLVPTPLLHRLLQMARDDNIDSEVRSAVLHALGNSAFDATNRRRYLQSPSLMELLANLAAKPDSIKPVAQTGVNVQQAGKKCQTAVTAAAPQPDALPGSCNSKGAEALSPGNCPAAKSQLAVGNVSHLGTRLQTPEQPQQQQPHKQLEPHDTGAASTLPLAGGIPAAGGSLHQGRLAQLHSALPVAEAAAAGPVGAPSMLVMQRSSSITRGDDGGSSNNTAEDAVPIAAAQTTAHAMQSVEPEQPSQDADKGVSPVITASAAPKGPSSTSTSAAAAAAQGAAAAGLTVMAEAVSAAKTVALAAATTAAGGNGSYRSGSSEGSTVRAVAAAADGHSTGVLNMPATGMLAAAAGAAAAAAAAAAAPQEPGNNAIQRAGSQSPLTDAAAAAAATATAAAIGDDIAPKRQKLVTVEDPVKLQAIRLLAILGQNEQVRIALGQPTIRNRGLRVLAMDGGGMKGMAMVELLRQLERRAKAPIWTLFDVIGGTSAGALLAVGLGILRLSLDECQDIYTNLGNKVFHQSVASSQEDAGWRESLYRVYATSASNMRVAVYGAKHNAAPYEELLRHFCAVKELGCASDRLIDTAVLGGPKVFVVATLASTRPAAPFAFRNYELPDHAAPAAAQLAACSGSCKYHVWEAVRASSAAPYYLDDHITPDGKRFQDGATTANNPAVIALQQARLLHPQLPLDCLVSLGCGNEPPSERSKGLSSVIDTGSVLLESACSSARVHAALAVTLPMVPGCKYYRFSCVDPRCAMELDDIKPESWRKLLSATNEYCSQPAVAEQFDELAGLLISGQSKSMPSLSAAKAHKQQQQMRQQQQSHAVQEALNSNEICSSLKLSKQQINVDTATLDSNSPTAFKTINKINVKAQQSGLRLLYNKGILLVEAPRKVADMAVEAAASANTPVLAHVRQQQQQEKVGRLLAAALPKRLLHRCDLTAWPAQQQPHKLVSVQQQYGAGQPSWEHVQQQQVQQPAVALPKQGRATADDVLSSLRIPKQQQQGKASYPSEPGSSPVTVGSPVKRGQQQQQQRRMSNETKDSGERQLAVPDTAGNSGPSVSSPKVSWFEYIFPWQSSPTTEQGEAAQLQPAMAGTSQAAASNKAGEGAQMPFVRSAPDLTGAPALQAAVQQDGQQPGRVPSSYAGHSPTHIGVKQLLRTGAAPGSLLSRGQPDRAGAADGAVGQYVQPEIRLVASGTAAALRHALAANAGVGVIHLALHSTPQGLVGGWAQDTLAVAEPGAAAADLLSYLGADPNIMSLSQLVSNHGPLLPTPDGGMLAVLGQQQVLAPAAVTASVVGHTAFTPLAQPTAAESVPDSVGADPAQQLGFETPTSLHHPVGLQLRRAVGSVTSLNSIWITSWLLQLTRPDARRHVSDRELYELLSSLQHLVVVSSSWLPPNMVQALLQGGVVAVVAGADAGAVCALSAADVAAYFEVFYKGLLQDGTSVTEALQSAAETVPSVGHLAYKCYQLE